MDQSAVRLQRDDLRGVKRVEVKRRGPTGAQVWIPGQITELSGKGAFVRLDEGGQNFFHFSDIRVPDDPPVQMVLPKHPPGPRALATIGDAVAQRTPPAPPPVPLPAPAPPPSKRGYTHRRHDVTPVGAAFRAFRLKEGLTQAALADLLGMKSHRCGAVELGSLNPSDEDIERFALLCDRPVAELLTLRDGDSPETGASSAPPQQVADLAPVAAVAALPAPPPPAPSPVGFEAFVDALDVVVPMPTDRERRRRWFALARELLDLSQGGPS